MSNHVKMNLNDVLKNKKQAPNKDKLGINNNNNTNNNPNNLSISKISVNNTSMSNNKKIDKSTFKEKLYQAN